MNMRRIAGWGGLITVLGWMLAGGTALAEFQVSLPPVKESQAYQMFAKRPASELSKLLYLIDRFKDADVKVIYEGDHYEAAYAAGVAKKFLLKNYHKESAEHWVKTYCHRAEKSGKFILFEAPDGTFRSARDVLMDELKVIEQIKVK